MRHIVHLITDLDCGGTEQQLVQLVKRAAGSHTVIALTGMDELAFDTIEAPEHEQRFISLGMQRHQLWKLVYLWWVVWHLKPDVLCTWLYHANLIGFVLAKLLRVKLVWNIRCSNMDLSRYRWTTRATRAVLPLLSERVEKVIFNSAAGLNYHVDDLAYHFQSSAIIPNGIDTEQFKPNQPAYTIVRYQLEMPPRTLLIGMVARVDPMKDYHTFLQAAHKLWLKYPVCFVVIGKGTERFNSPYVYGLGQRDDVANLLPALDIFTLCSKSEGLPNVVMEAMACSLPCIATDVGDTARLLGKDFVVPVGDQVALLTKWEQLLDWGEDKRHAIGKINRDRIVVHYNLKLMVEAYERCLS